MRDSLTVLSLEDGAGIDVISGAKRGGRSAIGLCRRKAAKGAYSNGLC